MALIAMFNRRPPITAACTPTLRTALMVFLASAWVGAAAQSPADARREIDNVAAFARLYGVVRHFYPADAVTTLDWDRYAVLGVSRVRSASDTASLEGRLQELFGPLGPRLEIGRSLTPAPQVGPIDAALIVWQYLGPGIVTPTGLSPYSANRTNRGPPVPAQEGKDFVTLMQNVSAAADLRGKRVRLRGRARVTALDAQGWAGLWLRVDRSPGEIGFFDDMQDRPIRQLEWREYVLEGAIADDATNIAFGVLAAGSMTADFDVLELAVANGGTWMPLPIRDPGFESDGDVRAAGWIQAGSSRSPQVTKAEGDAADGQRFLRLLATSGFAGSSPNTRTATGAYVDVDLTQGLRARVPLGLTDADAQASSTEFVRAPIDEIAATAGRSDLDVRLADVVVAWNVYRHFYPYWEEAGVDWDSRLVPQLQAAYAAGTREAHRRALQQLVADARDGHGTVADTVAGARGGTLPIQLRLIDGQLVVIASGAPDDAPVGAVVTAIDGASATERLESEMRLASGTSQWRAWRSTREMAACVPNSTTRMTMESPAGRREVSLPCAVQPPAERRPEFITELASGIWYVDLSRASMAQIRPALPKLADTTGVIFDLRGYPTDAGSQLLQYLVAEPENDQWMHVANITGPFGQVADWQSFGWNLMPAAPRLAGRRVFLTDGRAISYAESVMGYVKDHKLGTIVGSTTAGANGNVVRFVVPGGFAIAFTGMRVTGHDGRTPHHLVGVQPDIPLEPTIAGLREGRDELLDRAIALIRGN